MASNDSRAPAVRDSRPLVLHVVYRFDTGGLENGVVNLINHMPGSAYRHAVLSMTVVTDFKKRVEREDVEFTALNKPPGHGIWQYRKLYSLFKKMRPAIVHSRNLAALEVQAPAWAAGVPVRIHGEHGRDVGDLDGNNVTYQRMRRLYRPFVHHYTAVSRDLADYLQGKVRVPLDTITQAFNGVDTGQFAPHSLGAQSIVGCPFNPSQHWLVGTVGRMQTVKDQIMLANAFVLAIQRAPQLAERLRLVMVGEGPLRATSMAALASAGIAHLAWLPGERKDIAHVMRGLHAFALPSLAEGMSNTILEAMASGLPVVATAVGGNADLVQHGTTGFVVAPSAPHALAKRLVELATNESTARAMGEAGRLCATQQFSMQAMVKIYQGVYDSQLLRQFGGSSFSPNQTSEQR